MADNLTISVGIDTAKLRADNEVLKKQLSDATKQMKDFAKAGDTVRLSEASKNVDNFSRSLAVNQRAIREEMRALAGLGVAGVGASRGLHATAAAHAELREISPGATREVVKLSKELGNLETSGFAVAKMFKEIPKVAIPVAIATGVAAAATKLTNAAYANITALDDLAKASGFTSREVAALQHVFEGADVPLASLDKTLRSIGDTFDKAKVKATDFGSAISGVQTLHGAGGPAGAAVLRGGGPAASGIEGQGAVVVMRGGAPFGGIDPSKGFAGLLDPNQFKTIEEYFAALRRMLLNINKTAPAFARETIRAQGLDPEETLRGLAATSADEYRKALQATLGDPRLREGAVPLARQFGALTEQLGGEKDLVATQAGVGPMEGAVRDLPRVIDGLKATSDAIEDIRTKTYQWIDALKSVDFSSGAKSFEDSWTSAISDITQAWSSALKVLSTSPSGPGATAPVAPPMATGGVVPGSGSSDTVPAWLTPGEYVARRASVDYYGTSVFRALNNRALPRDLFSRIGYAAGGLVGASFAEGGIAGTSGTPVHVHLDGQAFAMTAHESVASALVVAARRQQMRSAGVKPSWYGGRPSG